MHKHIARMPKNEFQFLQYKTYLHSNQTPRLGSTLLYKLVTKVVLQSSLLPGWPDGINPMRYMSKHALDL